jgi:hypothetical protein
MRSSPLRASCCRRAFSAMRRKRSMPAGWRRPALAEKADEEAVDFAGVDGLEGNVFRRRRSSGCG